jgi:hypothetical protein
VLERLVGGSVTLVQLAPADAVLDVRGEGCRGVAVARAWRAGLSELPWFTRAKRNPGLTASTAEFHQVAAELGNDGEKPKWMPVPLPSLSRRAVL